MCFHSPGLWEVFCLAWWMRKACGREILPNLHRQNQSSTLRTWKRRVSSHKCPAQDEADDPGLFPFGHRLHGHRTRATRLPLSSCWLTGLSHPSFWVLSSHFHSHPPKWPFSNKSMHGSYCRWNSFSCSREMVSNHIDIAPRSSTWPQSKQTLWKEAGGCSSG